MPCWIFPSCRRSSRAWLASALLVAACAPALAASPSTAGVQRSGPAVNANAPVTFAQSQSDLAVDPAARFGRLPNGMTYVLYKNKTPPGGASVWMRVGAGSVMEQDDQRGLAHFIEHMIFKGSKNVAEGEMLKLLQRNGLAFGADTNAQTEPFQTVYKLNLPNASARILGDALFLMREAAGNVSFRPEAIESERGVILAEERVRAGVASEAAEVELQALLPGTTYPERLPIGKIDVIKTAQREAFVRFYNDFYRPEYTTLIVVGDIEPQRIEADIRRRFADWRPGPRSRAGATDYGRLTPPSAPQAKTFVAEGLPTTVSVLWALPAADGVQTRQKDAADLRFAISSAILNERLSRAANSPGAFFTGAGFQRDDIQRTARIYSLNLAPKDGQDRAAFDQAMAMYREYVQNGPTQAELDRVMSSLESSFRQSAASAQTVPTQAIAEKIVQALATQGVLQSPAQSLADFLALKPQFTLASIAGAFKDAALGEAPLLWRQGKDAPGFDEAALLAAYRAAPAQTVDAAASRAGAKWPYTSFGTPSKIVSRELLRGVDATRVTFGNGVVLTVKQTAFEQGGVHVAVQLGSGKMGLRPDQGASAFMTTQLARPSVGGLGKLTSDDLQEALTGKTYGLDFSIGTNATQISGATTPSDLAVQLQALTALITDPGFRPDALDRVKTELPPAYDAARTSPDGVYFMKATGDPYGGDPRFSTPGLADALAVPLEQIVALGKDQLGTGPVDVTVVGDIAPDEAIRQVGATLGAMPQLPAPKALPGSQPLRFPATDLRRVYTHDGRADQNLSVIVWPTTDHYADPRRSAGLELLAAVMTGRELDEVRHKQGASYSASVASSMSRHFPDFGFLMSRAMVRPEGDEAYFETVAAIATELQKTPVSADELKRARMPLIDRLRSAKSTNGYWMNVLSGSVRDARQIDAVRTQERDLLAVTPQDLQTLARSYLVMPRALRLQVRPKEAAASPSQ